MFSHGILGKPSFRDRKFQVVCVGGLMASSLEREVESNWFGLSMLPGLLCRPMQLYRILGSLLCRIYVLHIRRRWLNTVSLLGLRLLPRSMHTVFYDNSPLRLWAHQIHVCCIIYAYFCFLLFHNRDETRLTLSSKWAEYASSWIIIHCWTTIFELGRSWEDYGSGEPPAHASAQFFFFFFF